MQIFENKGAMMGCSQPPPPRPGLGHQLPCPPSRRASSSTQQAYFEQHGRDLVGDYLETELEPGERIVCRNEHFVALVPFWAVWPFETMLLPVRRVPDLPAAQPAPSGTRWPTCLRRLTSRYDNLFRTSFPYSMGFHGRPTDGEEHPWWRLHAAYFPPLLRSATVRKFLVGYELCAEPQRDLTAEDAAASRLRARPRPTTGRPEP